MTDAADDKREEITGDQSPVEAAPIPAPEHIAADELRTNAPAEPYVEPTLEQLLEEYDGARSQPRPQDGLYPWQRQQQGFATPEQAMQMQAVSHRLQQLEQSRFMDEVRGTADKIFGDLGAKLPQEFKLGWIEQKARALPNAVQAWRNRNVNPQAWNAWEQRLSKEVESAFRPLAVDADATGDHNAVAAAVRAAGGDRDRREPAPNYGAMSEKDFRRTVFEKHGFDPLMGS